jgi:tRNA dimethylallyltransferase
MEIKHIVIVGPTASGKTSLSIKLAKLYNAEIIAADSRTVYRGMDIGTAKPRKDEQIRARHHCLDLVYPNQPFTVADFKYHANNSLTDILNSRKLAITVGGSGLYVDSFIYDYSLTNHDMAVHQKYKDESIENLQQIIINLGLAMPENRKNKRYLLNTLARGVGANSTRSTLPDSTLLIGINPENDVIKENIRLRTDYMINNGVIEEVKLLNSKYGKGCKAMQGGVYKALQSFIEGQEDINAAKEKIKRSDWQLARRQRTWFKRNDDINWFNSAQQAESWLAGRYGFKI